jgi:hypothetical protein
LLNTTGMSHLKIPSSRRTMNKYINVLRQYDFVKRTWLYCIPSRELRESLFSVIFVDLLRFFRQVTADRWPMCICLTDLRLHKGQVPLIGLEDEGSRILRKVGWYTPSDTAFHPRRREFHQRMQVIISPATWRLPRCPNLVALSTLTALIKRDCSWITFYSFMKVTNKMQICRLIYYSKSALHVLGDVFVHRQENLTVLVLTVSGSVHPSCCRLVSLRFIQDTSRQQLGWTLPDTVNTANAPDDGRKHCPKHVELTWNNKLTYIFASCWLLS